MSKPNNLTGQRFGKESRNMNPMSGAYISSAGSADGVLIREE